MDKATIYLQAVLRAMRRLPGLDLPADALPADCEALLARAEALSMGRTSQPQGGFGQAGGPLLSILGKVKDGGISQWVPPVPLTCEDDSNFPQAGKPAQPDCSKIARLAAGILATDGATDAVKAGNLLDVLYTHATGIAAGEGELSDVSLYDQAHTMAAIAVCLASGEARDGETPFMLVGGDFSGIQSYIYQIVSKFAAKNLKGRSFYVKLLGDAVVRRVLDALGLYQANVIYNSGGSFYILAPNTQKAADALAKVKADIEERLFEAHCGAIYVAIASLPLTSAEVAGNADLKKRWGKLFKERDRSKQRKFSGYIKGHYAQLFNPMDIDPSNRADAITGLPFAKGETVKRPKDMDGEVSQLNYDQIKLGEVLRNTCRCIAVMPADAEAPKSWSGIHSIEPAGLGVRYYLLSLYDDEHKVQELPDFGKLDANAQIISLNAPVGSYDTHTRGRMFYGGNCFKGDSLNEMCDGSDGTLHRMGVLRMDVDNLGSIFQSGIADSKASLARYAALSRAFDFFFTGYINSICADSKKAYIVYAGGDDLFIVGDWREMIGVAEQVSRKFKAYTCGNQAFSISGGVAILGSKYPIIAGAQQSAEAEERAKGHKVVVKDVVKEKNSFTLLGMPLNWTEEFPAVKALKDALLDMIEKGRLNKSFLSKVMLHASMAGFKDHKVKNLRVFWLLSYDMTRYADDKAQSKDLVNTYVREACGTPGFLNGQSINTSYHSLELWALACRWAELEYRSNNNNNN